MLTLRLHLDPMLDENGPLVVCKGSHEPSGDGGDEASVVHCEAGDLFVMRPLLLHGSRASNPDTEMHRRVVHLEIGPDETLPGNYRWHSFKRLDVRGPRPDLGNEIQQKEFFFLHLKVWL